MRGQLTCARNRCLKAPNPRTYPHCWDHASDGCLGPGCEPFCHEHDEEREDDSCT